MRAVLTIMLGLMLATPVAAQTAETKRDTERMSTLISQQTGIVTVASVVPRGDLYDVKVEFFGEVTNYKGVMGVVIGAVGQCTRESKYRTEWCHIITRERGTERILTKELRRTQKLVLDGHVDAAWRYFKDHLRGGPWNDEIDSKKTASERNVAPAATRNIAEFENSVFYRKYGLLKSTSWPLRDGRYCHTYDVPGKVGLILEIQTKKGALVGAGVTFIAGFPLSEGDLDLVINLLRTLTVPEPPADLRDFIATGARTRVSQINRANSRSHGPWRVYSGLVGSDPVVSIER